MTYSGGRVWRGFSIIVKRQKVIFHRCPKTWSGRVLASLCRSPLGVGPGCRMMVIFVFLCWRYGQRRGRGTREVTLNAG